MANFLDLTGLQYFYEKLQDVFVKKVAGKGLSTNDFTTEEKNKLSGIAANANNYSHPNSAASAGTYKSVTINAQGHVTAGTNPTTLGGYGITDAKIVSGTITLGSNSITPLTPSSNLSAAKLTGTIDIARLPHGALERCVVVANQTARFALTTTQVQNGDTVKETETGLMYFVVDDTNLSTAAGYEVYTAGGASTVPWSGITGKPESFPPSTHAHAATQVTGLHTVATSGNYTDLTNKPTSLPANGGNAATVGGHTVAKDVPANAKFTDTIYTLPVASSTTLGGVKIGSSCRIDENGVLTIPVAVPGPQGGVAGLVPTPPSANEGLSKFLNGRCQWVSIEAIKNGSIDNLFL